MLEIDRGAPSEHFLTIRAKKKEIVTVEVEFRRKFKFVEVWPRLFGGGALPGPPHRLPTLGGASEYTDYARLGNYWPENNLSRNTTVEIY